MAHVWMELANNTANHSRVSLGFRSVALNAHTAFSSASGVIEGTIAEMIHIDFLVYEGHYLSEKRKRKKKKNLRGLPRILGNCFELDKSR